MAPSEPVFVAQSVTKSLSNSHPDRLLARHRRASIRREKAKTLSIRHALRDMGT